MSNNTSDLPVSWRDSTLATGVTHFIGIGGVGMSSVAETLLKFGGDVSGSDTRTSANTARLAGVGAKVFIGHNVKNVDKCSSVVFSTAVKSDNPEIVEARARQVPVMHRAEVLAELMRIRLSIAVSGTHGKTTTTSLISSLLDAGGLDPTVVNGGIMNVYGTNSKVGTSDWMVVEADESDGSFLKLSPDIAVVTNIDPEHLDHYGRFDAVRQAFRHFVQKISSNGCAVLCSDHPEVEALNASIVDRRLVTYGTDAQAQVRAVNITSSPEGSTFDVQIISTNSDPVAFKELKTPFLGRHNVLNSLAAISVALELGVTEQAIRNGLMTFGGVKRRFTTTGIARGVRVIDDYGHHPVEISAVLHAARESQSGRPGNIVAVFQPYRYTRLRDLFDDFCKCFVDADAVIVADVYPAGESYIDGADKEALVEGLRRKGHRNVISLSSASGLAGQVVEQTTEGSLVICFGAGDITDWAYALPGQLQQIV